MRTSLAAVLLLLGALGAAGCGPTGGKLATCAEAAAYNKSEHGLTLLVMKSGKVVCESHAQPWTRSASIASGTKALTGLLAVAAADDGLIDLDEPASRTLTEWRGDPARAAITLRQLLTLTSGLYSETDIPTAQQAIAVPVVAPPGERLIYNSAPYQVFGEVLRRKLAAANRGSVEDYF